MAVGDEWEVIKYEVDMWRELRKYFKVRVPFVGPIPPTVRNALPEAAVLHTRLLCDFLLSRGSYDTDIKLENLLPTFSSPTIVVLKDFYGDRKQSPPEMPPDGSVCWQFNTKLAHVTTHRGTDHDYMPAFDTVWPTMENLLREIAAEPSTPPGRIVLD